MNPQVPAAKPAFSEEVDEFVEFADPPGGRVPAFSEEVDEFVEFVEATESSADSAPSAGRPDPG